MARHQAVGVDLWHDDEWNDYSNRGRGTVDITRWASAEGGQSDPADIRLTLANEDRLFSVSHPASALYGRLGRQAPIRVRVGTAPVGAVNSDTVDTTSQVAPEIDAPTRGLLFCAWACPSGAATYTVPGSMSATASTAGARMRIAGARQVIAAAGPTGTRTATCSVSEDYVSASVFIPGPTALVTGSVAAADGDVVLDGNAGDWWVVASVFSSHPATPAADELRPVDFPRDTDGGGWALVADTGSVTVADTDAQHMLMRVWIKRVKHTGATHVIRTPASPGAEEALMIAFRVPAAQGFPWSVRGHGELAAMSPIRNLRGTVKEVRVQAYDLLSRLGADTRRPVTSPMRRFLTRRENRLVAYWPGEDDGDSTQLAAATPNTAAARLLGNVRPGSFDGFVGSAPVLEFGTGGSIDAAIPPHPPGDEYHHLLVAVPDGGMPDNQRIYSVHFAGGDVQFMQLLYLTGGGLRLRLFGFNDALIDETAPLGFNIDGVRFMMQVSLVNDGADLDTAVRLWEFVDTDLAPVLEVHTETFAGINVGRSRRLVSGREDPSGMAVGHIAIATVTQVVVGMEEALNGFNGERAGRRIERVLRDADIPVMLVGDPDDTEPMGPQINGTELEIARSCEAADRGILYGPKEALAVAYRTRTSMYNQDPTATLSFDGADNNVAPPWEPDPDITTVQNDVTVQRLGGSSARSVQETGPLNTGDPRKDPRSVAGKPAKYVLNLLGDRQVGDHAGFLRLVGTQPEPRFPQGITADLVREKLHGDPALIEAVAALDPGDLLLVTDPPDDVTPDDIEQLVIGAAETLSEQVWRVRSVGTPAGAYRVAVADDVVVGRADTAGSELAGSFVAGTDTSMSVATTEGPLWTTDMAEFPFDVVVSGVRLTVTAISGGSSPQTFTVTQTPVNGVAKTIPAGEDVRLWQPAVLGL